jgi:hypothetical protein
MSFKAYKMSTPSLTKICRVFDVDISSEAEGGITKDELIDLLLDFLGAPDVELTNANKETDKKPRPTSLDQTKKKKHCLQVEEAEPKVSDAELTNANKKTDNKPKPTSLDETKEEEHSIQVDEAEPKVSREEETEKEEEKEEGGKVRETKLPSDKALRKWVRSYVSCFNMERVTIRHALDTVSDKFGVDLTSKKARIKELLVEEF